MKTEIIESLDGRPVVAVTPESAADVAELERRPAAEVDDRLSFGDKPRRPDPQSTR